MTTRKLRVVLSWVATALLLVTSLASAEPYFGLYAGAAFPRENDVDFSNFRRLTGGRVDVESSDQGFETSGLLGGKFGYFLEPMPFLGFELDIFNIFGPDIDSGATSDLSVGGAGRKAPLNSVIDVGDTIDLRMTGVTMNILGRVPLMRNPAFPTGRLHPYIGVGGGWINAQLDIENPRVGGSDGEVTDAWAAQAVAGLKYYVAPQVALFTEYKYLHAFNLGWEFSGQAVRTDMDIHAAYAGVAFHFPKRVAAAPPPPPPPPPPVAPPPPPPPPPERRVERVVLQSVHFEFDKSRLTPLGRRVLDEAAQKMKENPNLSVEIEGHTDSVGTDLYNLGLGKRRAEVVKGYLVLRHQVDPKRMTSLSYGEARPIADNRTSEGRALNRRVEFKVLIR